MTASYFSQSAGRRVSVDSVNIFQLRSAAIKHHNADENHPDLAGMIAHIDQHDAKYSHENPAVEMPVYPWAKKP